VRRRFGERPDDAAASEVGAAVALHLEDLRAERGEEAAGVGTGPHPAQLEDAHTGEGEAGLGVVSGGRRRRGCGTGGPGPAVPFLRSPGGTALEVVVVLAEERRMQPRPRWSRRHAIRPPRVEQAADLGVVDLHEVAASRVLTAPEDVARILDGSDGDAPLAGAAVEIVLVLLRDPRLDTLGDLHQVLATVGEGPPLLARTPLRSTHELDQRLEVVVVEGVEDDEAVVRRHATHRRRPVGDAAPGEAVVAPPRDHGGDEGEDHLLQADVDQGAPARRLATVERRQGGDGGGESAVHADGVAAELDRRPVDVVRASGQQVAEAAAVDQGELVARHVASWAATAVGCDVGVDEAGILHA
jgi:hypothetical protein